MESPAPKFHIGDKVRFIGIQPGEEPYFVDEIKWFVQDHPILTVDGYYGFNAYYHQNSYKAREIEPFGLLEGWFVPADLPTVDSSEFLSLLRGEGRGTP